MASSGGDWVVTMDEDGQHDPRFLADLLDVAMREHASARLRAAHQPAAARSAPQRRVARREASDRAPRSAAPTRRSTRATGFVLGEVARSTAAFAGAGVYLDVAARLGRSGAHPSAPSSPARSSGATSGYSTRRLLSHFWRMVLSSGTRGLRVVSLLGVTLRGDRPAPRPRPRRHAHRRRQPPAGWTSTIVITLVSTGAVLFSLGVIAEYIGVAVNMAMGKPPYLIVSDPDDGPARSTPTPMTLGHVLVVGGGGLLGAAVCRELDRGASARPVAVPWSDADGGVDAIVAACAGRGAQRRTATGAWPGAPVPGSSAPPSRSCRTRSPRSAGSRRRLLDRRTPRRAPPSSRRRPAACTAAATTRRSPSCPTPAARRVRARQAPGRARGRPPGPATRVVLGRIANLYGPGQDLAKNQGLISRLCRSNLSASRSASTSRSTRCATTSTSTTAPPWSSTSWSGPRTATGRRRRARREDPRVAAARLDRAAAGRVPPGVRAPRAGPDGVLAACRAAGA